MKKKPLSAKEVEHMQPREQRYEVAAGPPRGLYLVVQKTGAKSFSFRYRFAGRTRKLTWNDLSLAAARAQAQAAVDDLDEGRDPAQVKANDDAAADREKQATEMAQESIKRAAEEFIKRGLGEKEKARGETERILRKEIIKPWSNRSIADIRKPDVLSLLDAIVDRKASVMACRTRGVMLRFFDWSKGRGYIETSPMLDIPKPGPDHKDRERYLEPAELAEVWQAAEQLGYPLGPFLKLLVLTAQRRGEVSAMRWQDVNLDKALWIIPGAATKNGRTHHVPLAAAAVEILRSLPRFTKGDFVFTSASGEKAINGFSKAKDRIDELTLAAREEAGIEKNIPDWTMHDIRRTCATLMAQECKVQPHILTRVLNHTSESDRETSKLLRKVYDRYQYLDEKRDALQAWSDFVVSLEVKTGKKATA